jgi:hypothetical protein
MTSRKLAIALLVVCGCGSSKSENPTSSAETAPKLAVVAPAAEAKAVTVPAKCGDGKLTVQDTAAREQDRATVFCKDDGTAAIQHVLVFRGEVQTKTVVPISIDRWNEIWRLADAANWQSAPLLCTPEEPEPSVSMGHSVEVFRAGIKRTLDCSGAEFAGPWQALASEVFKSQPARAE